MAWLNPISSPTSALYAIIGVQQIPFGNDNKKSKDNDNGKSNRRSFDSATLRSG